MVNKFLCFIFCFLFQINMDHEPRLAFKITAGQPISEAPLVPVKGNLLRGIDNKTVGRDLFGRFEPLFIKNRTRYSSN